jgi:transposase
MRKCIGVDLHKRQFTVCIMEGVKEKIKEYEVSKRGIREFKKELNKETEVAVEATGNSGYFYDEIIGEVKEVILINPLEFKAISSSTKKTDKNDAKTICRHLVANMLPQVRYLKEEERELRSLINLRDNYVKDKNGYKTRIDNILSSIGEEEIKGEKESKRYEEKIEGLKISVVRKLEIKSLIKQIQGLEEEIKKLSQEINKIGKKKQYHESLKSITGIGDLSATIIGNAIVEIEDFEDEKKLCAYAGLIPSVRDSGGKQRRGKITKKGNKLLRTILVQAATTAIRYGNVLREFYLRLKKAKGHGKAIVATARKMLVIIYYTLKNGVVYEDFNNGVIDVNKKTSRA